MIKNSLRPNYFAFALICTALVWSPTLRADGDEDIMKQIEKEVSTQLDQIGKPADKTDKMSGAENTSPKYFTGGLGLGVGGGQVSGAESRERVQE